MIFPVFPALPPFFELLSAVSRPEGEEDEYRLEEQTNEACLVGVQTVLKECTQTVQKQIFLTNRRYLFVFIVRIELS